MIKKGDVVRDRHYGVLRVVHTYAHGGIAGEDVNGFSWLVTTRTCSKVDNPEDYLLKVDKSNRRFTALKRALKEADKYQPYQGCGLYLDGKQTNHVGCMAYLQDDEPRYASMHGGFFEHSTWIGPNKDANRPGIPISENQFQKFKTFVGSLHPKIKRQITKSKPTLDAPIVSVDTGHGHLNYLFMVVWRLVWQTPKLVLVASYLKAEGFTSEEVLVLIALFSNVFADQSYSFIVEHDCFYDEYLIRKIKTIEQEVCEKRYSMQEKLQGGANSKEFRGMFGEKFITEDVLSRIDVLKEFIRENFWVELGSVCGPSKFPEPAKAHTENAPEGPGWYVRDWDDMAEDYGYGAGYAGDLAKVPRYFNRNMREFCNTRVPEPYQGRFRVYQDPTASVFWGAWEFSRAMVEWRE